MIMITITLMIMTNQYSQENSSTPFIVRRIVLIAIQDEGNRASAAHSAMIAVGAKAPISSGYRGSYALIGYKGKEEVDFVAQKKANRRRGPSVLSATVNTMPPTGEWPGGDRGGGGEVSGPG